MKVVVSPGIIIVKIYGTLFAFSASWFPEQLSRPLASSVMFRVMNLVLLSFM